MALLTHYILPALWAALLLASFVGWGTLVRGALGVKRRDANWGLTAGWGISLILAMGGGLQLAAVCNARVLETLVIIGAILWCLDAVRSSLDRQQVTARMFAIMSWRTPAPSVSAGILDYHPGPPPDGTMALLAKEGSAATFLSLTLTEKISIEAR